MGDRQADYRCYERTGPEEPGDWPTGAWTSLHLSLSHGQGYGRNSLGFKVTTSQLFLPGRWSNFPAVTTGSRNFPAAAGKALGGSGPPSGQLQDPGVFFRGGPEVVSWI